MINQKCGPIVIDNAAVDVSLETSTKLRDAEEKKERDEKVYKSKLAMVQKYILQYLCAILSFLGFEPRREAQHCAENQKDKLQGEQRF